MMAWAVYGPKHYYYGRLLARDENEALERAALYWGAGRKYVVTEVKAKPPTTASTKKRKARNA